MTYDCQALHGDITQANRESTLAGFKKGSFKVRRAHPYMYACLGGVRVLVRTYEVSTPRASSLPMHGLLSSMVSSQGSTRPKQC